MNSRWNDKEAQAFLDDPLSLRVYTSRLLGNEPDLVLHGGGNTSVKVKQINFFGEEEELLLVKGSGWDLATIEAPGFSPVKLEVLKRLATFESLSDTDMVRQQRAALTNPYAPNPSVEAILHAIIPFDFVDHTHADAVVTITNTENGEDRIKEIYGDRVLIIPYVMPGFILARKIYEMTQGLDWDAIEGLILMNHGVFTFNNNGKEAYEKMIQLVTEAEEYLMDQGAVSGFYPQVLPKEDLKTLAHIRKTVSHKAGKPMIAKIDQRPEAVVYGNQENLSGYALQGPLTPDHIIRTKRIPVIIKDNIQSAFDQYESDYQSYFETFKDDSLTMLDPAPRWAVWPEHGTISFGQHLKAASIVHHITEHTKKSILQAERLGGWQSLPQQDLFEVEYWELEQAKLKKTGKPALFQGKIVMVTGAASGIGKACAEGFAAKGALVAALDINPEIEQMFDHSGIVGIQCDVTDKSSVQSAIEDTVRSYGGLDVLVSNAGIFFASESIQEMSADTWDKSMSVNLTSHQRMLQQCIPYLTEGIDPAVVIIASKNVPAPGPGASAYSVAKAGLTQLARVAALELGTKGIRVNVMHPNAVFDTGIWTDEVLTERAKRYGLTIDEYKTRNVLRTEVTSHDVAELACAMAGPLFAKTTGAQIPIDGGNERVI